MESRPQDWEGPERGLGHPGMTFWAILDESLTPAAVYAMPVDLSGLARGCCGAQAADLGIMGLPVTHSLL